MPKSKVAIRLEIKGGLGKLVQTDWWGEITLTNKGEKITLAGFTINQYEIYLDSLNTEEKFQKKGYGSIVIDTLKGIAIFLDKPIVLFSSGDSVDFYKKMGFVTVTSLQKKRKLKVITSRYSKPDESDLIWVPDGLLEKNKKRRIPVTV